MIKALKQFFDDQLSQPVDARPTEHVLRVAAAALLIEVGRSDHSMDAEERSKINRLVQNRFGLSAGEAASLVNLAEQEVRDATSLHGFVSLINEYWSERQRVDLVEFMWQVAYADRKLDDHEVHLMRKIQRLLYIPHKQFIGAKLRAKKSAD